MNNKTTTITYTPTDVRRIVRDIVNAVGADVGAQPLTPLVYTQDDIITILRGYLHRAYANGYANARKPMQDDNNPGLVDLSALEHQPQPAPQIATMHAMGACVHCGGLRHINRYRLRQSTVIKYTCQRCGRVETYDSRGHRGTTI
jgi:hypothetical protein